jgi:hypothetical protein
MRYLLVILALLLSQPASARAEVSVGIGISFPGVDIGIRVPAYPRLVRIPDYPVYYDPRADANYFFYDGLYWIFIDDYWYASSWYDGPWHRVERDYVPLFVLRVPVRYYRRPPPYFRGWHKDRPPHWDEHWGRDWHERRHDWDRWDRRSAPRPAPLPTYQRRYSGERYPREIARQQSIRTEKYRYHPREETSQRYNERHRDDRGDDRGGGRGDRHEGRGDKDRGRDHR